MREYLNWTFRKIVKWLSPKRQLFIEWFRAIPERQARMATIVVIALSELVLILYCWGNIEKYAKTWEETSLKDVILTLITLASAPIALFIWHWRDANNLANIEIARGDLFLKDFHQIEQWATSHENKTLQLAAVHQLLPFAKGDHGKTFVMPAQEIYRSLLKTWHTPQVAEEGKKPEVPDHIAAIHRIVKSEWRSFEKAREGGDK